MLAAQDTRLDLAASERQTIPECNKTDYTPGWLLGLANSNQIESEMTTLILVQPQLSFSMTTSANTESRKQDQQQENIAVIQSLTRDLTEINKPRLDEIHGPLTYFLSAWKRGPNQVKMNVPKDNPLLPPLPCSSLPLSLLFSTSTPTRSSLLALLYILQ